MLINFLSKFSMKMLKNQEHLGKFLPVFGIVDIAGLCAEDGHTGGIQLQGQVVGYLSAGAHNHAPRAFQFQNVHHAFKGEFVEIEAVTHVIVYKLYNRFDGKHQDPRGFTKSDSGIYGTASWMDEKEMHEVLEVSPIGQAEGTILGEYKGKAVCMPKDTRLNRHIAIFGASGTMKSRAIIRNALFQIIRRGECAIARGRDACDLILGREEVDAEFSSGDIG